MFDDGFTTIEKIAHHDSSCSLVAHYSIRIANKSLPQLQSTCHPSTLPTRNTKRARIMLLTRVRLGRTPSKWMVRRTKICLASSWEPWRLALPYAFEWYNIILTLTHRFPLLFQSMAFRLDLGSQLAPRWNENDDRGFRGREQAGPGHWMGALVHPVCLECSLRAHPCPSFKRRWPLGTMVGGTNQSSRKGEWWLEKKHRRSVERILFLVTGRSCRQFVDAPAWDLLLPRSYIYSPLPIPIVSLISCSSNKTMSFSWISWIALARWSLNSRSEPSSVTRWSKNSWITK